MAKKGKASRQGSDDERTDFKTLVDRWNADQTIVPRDKLPLWIQARLPLGVTALKCSSLWLANV